MLRSQTGSDIVGVVYRFDGGSMDVTQLFFRPTSPPLVVPSPPPPGHSPPLPPPPTVGAFLVEPEPFIPDTTPRGYKHVHEQDN